MGWVRLAWNERADLIDPLIVGVFFSWFSPRTKFSIARRLLEAKQSKAESFITQIGLPAVDVVVGFFSSLNGKGFNV